MVESKHDRTGIDVERGRTKVRVETCRKEALVYYQYIDAAFTERIHQVLSVNGFSHASFTPSPSSSRHPPSSQHPPRADRAAIGDLHRRHYSSVSGSSSCCSARSHDSCYPSERNHDASCCRLLPLLRPWCWSSHWKRRWIEPCQE